METPPARSDPFDPEVDAVRQLISDVLAHGANWLDADTVARILAAYGIPPPLARPASDAKDAAAVAAAIGFPVVLKIRSPDITHKTHIGGVVLRLGDANRVREAAATMLARVRAARPEARIDGLLVQQMAWRPDAIELLIGLSQDPVFGPVVVFGQGGTAVEVVRDSAIGLPPLNQLLVRAQMQRTRVWGLLQAYRGKPTAAIDMIAEARIRIGQLATDHSAIQELDINPLLADPAA
jgi:acetyltransferase